MVAVEEEDSSRGVEGFGGGPETAEREKILLTESLVKTKVCKGEEGGESACTSTVTEGIAEEGADDNEPRVGDIYFGDYGEVSDSVGKNIQDRHAADDDGTATSGDPARTV